MGRCRDDDTASRPPRQSGLDEARPVRAGVTRSRPTSSCTRELEGVNRTTSDEPRRRLEPPVRSTVRSPRECVITEPNRSVGDADDARYSPNRRPSFLDGSRECVGPCVDVDVRASREYQPDPRPAASPKGLGTRIRECEIRAPIIHEYGCKNTVSENRARFE